MATNVKKCEECGAEFSVDKFHGYQRYCSHKCKDRAYKKRIRGKRPNNTYRYHREKLINMLGGRCVACGTDDFYVLTLDHVLNDRNGKRNDRQFIQAMLKNIEEARKHLQVLCWNHNTMKEFHPEEFYRRFPHLSWQQGVAKSGPSSP